MFVMKKKQKHIGLYLAERRKKAMLSQLALSKKLGYKAYQPISSVERGTCDLPPHKAKLWLKLIRADKRKVYNFYINKYIKDVKKGYGL